MLKDFLFNVGIQSLKDDHTYTHTHTYGLYNDVRKTTFLGFPIETRTRWILGFTLCT